MRDDEAVEVSLTEAGTTLTIRLDPADGPISGVLVVGGDRRDFSGWIQLAALIDSLRPPADAGPAARPQELSSRSADAPGSPEAPRAS